MAGVPSLTPRCPRTVARVMPALPRLAPFAIGAELTAMVKLPAARAALGTAALPAASAPYGSMHLTVASSWKGCLWLRAPLPLPVIRSDQPVLCWEG